MISCKALGSGFSWFWRPSLAHKDFTPGQHLEAVPGHGREEVVLNLEIKVSAEPVIKELLHIAGGFQLAAEQ